MEAQSFEIPQEISDITKTLRNKGFEAYIVGGCVRDLILGKRPKDWDVTTNAEPQDIEALFSKTFYENSFGTVTVVNEGTEDETLKNVEITPYRLEGKYSDKRRPDEVSFTKNIEEDLRRRDFTINALAYSPEDVSFIDLYKGHADLNDRIIRAVGSPDERFNEDSLRMLRAVRLATELGFVIEKETAVSILKHSENLKDMAVERIQAEFNRILMSDNPKRGIELAHELGLLKYILPELEDGIGVEQNGDHIYDVWEHNLRALEHAASKDWVFHVRLGALLHDIGKPETRRFAKEKDDWTFYGHDVVGARIATRALTRLKYPTRTIELVSKLVRHHLFFSDIDKITLSAVRRIVSHMGPEHVWDLMKVRACDRIGMGRPKEQPYRLRKYEAMIEEAMRAPISVGMLKINGEVLMQTVHVKPGPRMGWMLHALLEEVLDDPEKNTPDYLVSRATELDQLPDMELKALGDAGKDKKEEIDAEEVSDIRKRHWVK